MGYSRCDTAVFDNAKPEYGQRPNIIGLLYIACSILATLLLGDGNLSAQNSLSLDFSKRINSWSAIQGFSSMDISSSGFIFAGNIDSVPAAISGCNVYAPSHDFLVLTDTNATLQWAHCYDARGLFDWAVFGNEGQIWTCGNLDTFIGCPILNDTSRGTTIIKFDSIGNPRWYNNYGNVNSYIYDFVSSEDGGVLIFSEFNYAGGDIAYTYSNDPLTFDCWVCKLDSTGRIQWNFILGGSGDDRPQKIKEIKPGVFAALMLTTSTDYMLQGLNDQDTAYVPWIVEFDLQGDITNSRVVNEPGYAAYRDFDLLNDGTIILVGNPVGNDSTTFCNSGVGTEAFILTSLDSGYHFDWCTINGGADGYLEYVCVVNDSLVVAAGTLQSAPPLANCDSFSLYAHTWFGLYNLNLRQAVWGKALCGSVGDELSGLLFDSAENALYLLTNSASTDGDFAGLGFPSSGNMYLLKYSLITTGIENLEASNLQFSVFPNPANEHLNVKVGEMSGQINLRLMDLIGHVIAVDRFQQPEYQLQTEGLAPGMYLIEISDYEGKAGVRKFVKEQ